MPIWSPVCSLLCPQHAARAPLSPSERKFHFKTIKALSCSLSLVLSCSKSRKCWEARDGMEQKYSGGMIKVVLFCVFWQVTNQVNGASLSPSEYPITIKHHSRKYKVNAQRRELLFSKNQLI